jgi:amino acid transporter
MRGQNDATGATAGAATAGGPGGSGGEPALERTIGWKQMAFYGLGGMLGAGIYGLVGRAAGQMGSAIWLAFLVSMVAALLTGLSYANIGSRYPRAGGAAYVTQRAYGLPLLTYVVGLAVMCSGLSSIATQSRVVAENLQRLAGLEGVPTLLLAVGFLLLLAGIVFRGIRECMWLNIGCTTVEVAGLLLIILVGLPYWGSANLLEVPPAADGSVGEIGLLMVMNGAVLTFFSFIGFEDTLNVAEEVKDPQRNLPLGLMLAMLGATVIYMAVAITAVSVVPWRELAAAPGPLAEVMNRAAPWFPQIGFIAITIFAVANTALLNYVMGSRLAYGMARQGLLPKALGRVHAGRRTPHVAIGILLVIAVGAGPRRRHLAARLLDRDPAAGRVHGRERRPGAAEAAPERAEGRLRGADLRPGAGRAGLRVAAGEPPPGRRLARPRHRRRPDRGHPPALRPHPADARRRGGRGPADRPGRRPHGLNRDRR